MKNSTSPAEYIYYLLFDWWVYPETLVTITNQEMPQELRPEGKSVYDYIAREYVTPTEARRRLGYPHVG